jgi:hypothetical protein
MALLLENVGKRKKVQFCTLKLRREQNRTRKSGKMASRAMSKILILTATAFSLAASAVCAKAYHPTAREMIKGAEFIALVSLDEPVKQETIGKWTYGEVSTARLSKQIKGKLPEKFKIYSRENFKCAQCYFPKGDNLVFLKKDQDLFVGQAWNISCLPVSDHKVAWFSNLDLNKSDSQSNLNDCIKQIQSELKN